MFRDVGVVKTFLVVGERRKRTFSGVSSLEFSENGWSFVVDNRPSCYRSAVSFTWQMRE